MPVAETLPQYPAVQPQGLRDLAGLDGDRLLDDPAQVGQLEVGLNDERLGVIGRDDSLPDISAGRVAGDDDPLRRGVPQAQQV